MEPTMSGGGSGAQPVRRSLWVRGNPPIKGGSGWGICLPKPEPGVVGDKGTSPTKAMLGISRRRGRPCPTGRKSLKYHLRLEEGRLRQEDGVKVVFATALGLTVI